MCSTAIIAHHSRPANCPVARLGQRFSYILTDPYTLQQHRGLGRTGIAPLRPEHFLAPITKTVKQSAVRRVMAQHSTTVTMSALSGQQQALPASLDTSDSNGRNTRSPLQSLQPARSCSSQLCSIQSSCRWCCCKALPTAVTAACLLHYNAWEWSTKMKTECLVCVSAGSFSSRKSPSTFPCGIEGLCSHGPHAFMRRLPKHMLLMHVDFCAGSSIRF